MDFRDLRLGDAEGEGGIVLGQFVMGSGGADELRELGVLEGLEREVAVRAGVIWTSLRGKRDALDLFAKKLHLTREDALRLQKLLHLS